MIGLLTALASFLFLFVSGYPLACLFWRAGPRGLRLVLSPLLGLCLDAIVLYVLGYYGNLPTRLSAIILLAVVLALNVLAAVRDKSYFRIRGAESGPLLASLVYLLILAVPFFIVGRGYMSVWSEDFFGYVTVADYLKDHTVNERLDPELVSEHPVYERIDGIVRGTFQGQFYRLGTEYQLSFVSVVLKGHVGELFFPVLISFAMLMPLGLFLFLGVFGFPRRLALAAVFLLSLFSFHYFGFIAQFLAQAAGLPVVLLCYWTLGRAFAPDRKTAGLALLAISLIGAIILYVEASVLLVPIGIYWVVQWIRRKRRFTQDLKTAAVVLLVLAVFFNVKFLSVVRFEIAQSGLGHLIVRDSGQAVQRPILFPYFFVETGVPTVWGLVTAPLGAWPFNSSPRVVLWFVMILSAVLFGMCGLGIWRFPFEKRALWISIAAFLAAAGGLAFFVRIDYLLFKLILWFQFFFCAALWAGVWIVLKARRHRLLARAVIGLSLVLLTAFNAVNIVTIGRASLGGSTVWVEWSGASRKDPLRGLAAAKASLNPHEPLTAIIPDFHPGRWASYVLKDFRINFLVNSSREHFRTRYEGPYEENGWKTSRLLLVKADEDIFNNRLPAGAVVREAGYFLIADAGRVSNYLFPVSTRRGIIRQTSPEIAATIGWYPYEVYPQSPWAFDRRGFRWIENNSAFLIKNVTRESLRLKFHLEIAAGVEPAPMSIDFSGQPIFSAEMSAQARLLSEPFTPAQDGLGRIVFRSAGTRINGGRMIRVINRDIGTDDRLVNARIGQLGIVPEADTKKAGFFFGGDHFTPADMEKDNFYFAGLYPDGWAAPRVGFLFDLKDRRSFRYRISVPAFTLPDGFVITVSFNGKPAAHFPMGKPGEAVLEVPIPPEFRKASRVEIATDRAWPISAKDGRRSAYIFREGELLR
jgi:hypothetical protein